MVALCTCNGFNYTLTKTETNKNIPLQYIQLSHACHNCLEYPSHTCRRHCENLLITLDSFSYWHRPLLHITLSHNSCLLLEPVTLHHTTEQTYIDIALKRSGSVFFYPVAANAISVAKRNYSF
jgi:hypothetical protein